MKKLISEKFAVRALFAILSLVVLFHLLIIFGVIPFSIVWGGRISSSDEMLRFEMVSIGMNLLLLLIISIKARWIRLRIHHLVLKIVLWLMTILFLLNTVGNLLSQNDLEKLIFTPLTFILMIFSFRLAISQDYSIRP
jgi:hypothetical protein